MRLFSTLVLVLTLGALLCFSSPASAGVLFQDNYESYAVGTVLGGSVTPPPGPVTPPVGEAYTLVTDYSGTQLNYAEVHDVITAAAPGEGNSTKFVGPRSSGTSHHDWLNISAANKTAVTGEVVTFDFDAFVEGGTVTPVQSGLDFGTFADQSYGGAAWNILLGTNGHAYYYDTDFRDAGTYTTDSWVHVNVTANYGDQTFDATVGALGFSGNFQTANGNDTFAALSMSRDLPAAGLGIYYDNMIIQSDAVPTPEPSTLLLTSIGMLGLLAYAWRKRK